LFKLTPRLTILIVFAAFGVMVGSNAGSFPVLVKQAVVSREAFGFMGGLGMLANIIALSLGGFMNRHADHRTMLLLMLPSGLVSLWYTLIVGSPFSYGLSVIIFSFILGTTDIFMNAEASFVEQEVGKPIFSSFHGSAMYGIALGGLCSSLVSTWVAPWAAGIAAIPCIIFAIYAVYKTIPHRPVDRHQENPKRVILPRRLLTSIGIAAGLNVSCEVASIQWAGQLLESIAPQLAAYSGLGLAFYGICSGSMRFAGDGLRARFGDQRTMVISLCMGISGLAVLSFAPGFWISVIAFAAVGAGLSIVFPCLFSLAAKLVPEARAAALGYVSMVGGLPRIVLPWVLGFLAQHYSLSAVFGACVVVASTALIIIISTFAKADAAVIR
jgi:predicted MFS family arabinose efflux permease